MIPCDLRDVFSPPPCEGQHGENLHVQPHRIRVVRFIVQVNRSVIGPAQRSCSRSFLVTINVEYFNISFYIKKKNKKNISWF
jgi:hypothetical protein